jgi:hypothetical protein
VGDFNGDGKADLLYHGGGWGPYCGQKTSSWKDLPWQRQYPELCEYFNQETGSECWARGTADKEDEAFVDGRLQRRWRASCYQYDSHWQLARSGGDHWLPGLDSGAGIRLFQQAATRCVVGDFAAEGKSSVACDLENRFRTGLRLMSLSGGLPDLLVSAINDTAGTITLKYATTGSVPDSHVPSAISILSATLHDSGTNPKAWTEYSYFGAFYNPFAGEFRGFEHVVIKHPQESNDDQRQRVDTIFYHQGDGFAPTRDDPTVLIPYTAGRPYLIQIGTTDGHHYSDTTLTYRSSTPPEIPYRAQPIQISTKILEDKREHSSLNTFHYDNASNLVKIEREIAAEPTLNRTIVRAFVKEPNSPVALLLSESVYNGLSDASPDLLLRTEYTYDDVDSTCTTASLPRVGNVTRIRKLLRKGSQDAYVERWLGYDGFGNAVCERDPNKNVVS